MRDHRPFSSHWQHQIRSMLRTHLATLQPVELVLPPPVGGSGTGAASTPAPCPHSEATAQALAAAPGASGIVRNVTRGGREAWTPEGALKVGRVREKVRCG